MAYWRLGAALEPLRHGGVLVVGSGSATHNLSAFDPDYTAPPPPWVRAFDDWLAMVIATGRWHDVLNYRQLAPFARENHPTEEHFWPLMVMLGAAGDKGTVLHRGYTYGAFSMAAFAFGDDV
jgi:4,5-DOPA dioxygenase extradiol